MTRRPPAIAFVSKANYVDSIKVAMLEGHSES